jgi:hypothetical protein
LRLTLTGLNVNGQHYRIDTSSLTRTKKGKGKRTTAFIGGGSGLGMLIGGAATGSVCLPERAQALWAPPSPVTGT